MSVQPALVAQGITKRFPGVVALQGVSLSLYPGEVHALVGENGAGKSTLVKVLSGALRPDEGIITVGGRSFSFLNPYEARKVGIATVYQEQQLIPTLTVAENIFLGKEWRRKGGLVDFKRIVAETRRMIDFFGLSLNPKARVEELSVAERQEVIILKVWGERARVILLDEPTAALSKEQVQFFFRLVERLRDQGIAVLYISHHLEEVLEIAQRITVLRDGKKVDTFQAHTVDKNTLVEKMAGHRLTRRLDRERKPPGEVVLRLENLGDGKTFHGISLTLRRGEIVGFVGVTGSGCREILRALVGVHKWKEGAVFIGDSTFFPRSTMEAARKGIFFMPEDMRREGLVLPMSFPKNITLPRLEKVVQGGVIRLRREEEVAQRYVQTLNIVAPRQDAEVGILSGGNQRKVLLARALFSDAWLWLLEDPTQGIDVETRVEVHHLLLQARSQGKSILLFSSDLEELLTLADRIMVFHKGRIVREIIDPVNTTTRELLREMLGG
ncbi:MAG: sugar ABC transporter ATP-binding protein [Candidatus Caldatribacteriaceae bacterium]